ncbi:MAG: 50S ribosomal protein L21 [Gaiellaceae bacterium]
MSYAIISLGGKQYRVQPGEYLLVDRVKTEAGKTFQPTVLMVGGDGKADFTSKTTVTARVVEHLLGEKIRIGKYKAKSGYKKHTGYRSRLTKIEIEAIGAAQAAAKGTEEPAATAKPQVESEPAPQPTPAALAGAVPEGYARLTVAQVAELAPDWDRLTLEAALAYEGAHGQRKGATAALESAIASKQEGGF